MEWTLAQLAAAYAALPAGTSDAAAAALLAAQTTTTTNVAFPLQSAIAIALTSTNFSWARIVQRAKGTAVLPPTTQSDYAVLAAITVTETAPTQVIDPAVTAAWTAWQAGIAALQAIGDLSTADVAAINALTSVTTPVFTPTPTQYDVETARGGL